MIFLFLFFFESHIFVELLSIVSHPSLDSICLLNQCHSIGPMSFMSGGPDATPLLIFKKAFLL